MPETPPKPILMPEPKQLVRAAIHGITDKVPDLKAEISKMNLDEHLKAYIANELDEIETNAAEVHMHDVEMPGGGFNLHLCIKPRQLGAGETTVFVRKS